jgi:CPA2 family monovalent cation:H+ antiporter-2
MALKESGIRDRYNCMVVGLEEGKENLSNVSPNYRFKEGDIIWIVGEEASIQSIMHPCS